MTPTAPLSRGNITDLTELKAKTQFAANKAQYGDKIRERRIACGINQPQLARVLGVSKNTICNWEAGRSRPDLNQLVLLCETLKTTVPWFLGAPDRLSDLTKEELRHLKNYRFLSVPNKQAVDRLIDAMLDIEDKELHARCKNGFQRIHRNGNKTAAGVIGNNLSDYQAGEYLYVRTSRAACMADEIITVTGDSMEPTFHDGDDLLVEHTEELSPGEIGIFVADGEGYVKEFQPDGLHSHNPRYPVLKFSEDDHFRCVGRVLGVVAPDQYPTGIELEALEDIQREKRPKE